MVPRWAKMAASWAKMAPRWTLMIPRLATIAPTWHPCTNGTFGTPVQMGNCGRLSVSHYCMLYGGCGADTGRDEHLGPGCRPRQREPFASRSREKVLLAKMAPSRRQVDAKSTLRWAKMGQDDAKSAPRGVKMGPRSAKMAASLAKMAPRWTQMKPRWAKIAPTWHQIDAKIG